MANVTVRLSAQDAGLVAKWMAAQQSVASFEQQVKSAGTRGKQAGQATAGGFSSAAAKIGSAAQSMLGLGSAASAALTTVELMRQQLEAVAEGQARSARAQLGAADAERALLFAVRAGPGELSAQQVTQRVRDSTFGVDVADSFRETEAALSARGKLSQEAALTTAEKARELDPLSLIINTIVGIAYYMARRYDESILNHKKALEMDPDFLLAKTYIILPYVECGKYDEVVDIIRETESSAAEHTYTLAYFGGAYARAGLKDDAVRILNRLDELARRRYVSALHRAIVLVGMGEYDDALDLIEKSIEDRCPISIFHKTAPYLDCLESNKRFQSLLKKVGL